MALYWRPLDAATVALLVVIGLLLVASAAMSASEVALFSLNPTQLRDLPVTEVTTEALAQLGT